MHSSRSSSRYVLGASIIASQSHEGFHFTFDGAQIELRRERKPQHASRLDLLVQIGEHTYTVATNEEQRIEFVGESGAHSLRVLNARSIQAERLGFVRQWLRDGIGASVDDIPVHNSYFDPHYHLHRSVKGIQLYLTLILLNVLYGYYLAYNHQIEWALAQFTYGIPYFIVHSGLQRFRHHQVRVVQTVLAISIIEATLFLLDPLVIHSRLAVTNPALLLPMLALRAFGLRIMYQGIRAAKSVEKVNAAILADLLEEAPVTA